MNMFTVIIPVYNKGPYLDACLDSVFRQTYSNYEVILVDGGSTDTSLKIASKYALNNPNMKIIFQRSLGAGGARNEGLIEAKGEYVLFLDADDYWNDNDILKKMDECIIGLVELPNVLATNIGELVNGEIKTIYCFGNESTDSGWYENSDEKGIIYYFHAFAYRRSFLLENTIFFPESSTFEDPTFLSKVMIITKRYYFLKDSFYVYRRGTFDVRNFYNENKCKELTDNIFYIADMARENGCDAIFNKVKECLYDREGLQLLIQSAMGKCEPLLRTIVEMPGHGFDISDMPQACFLYDSIDFRVKNDIDELIRLVNMYENVYIYGAGVYGQRIIPILTYYGIPIQKLCFVQTRCPKSYYIQNIRCKEIDTITILPEKDIVIVSAEKKARQEMISKLKEMQVEKYIEITKELYYSLVWFYYRWIY